MKIHRSSAAQLAAILVAGLMTAVCWSGPESNAFSDAAGNYTSPCKAGDAGGLQLPAGFCATVFADNIGHARHLVVSPEGVVYVNTWSGSYYPAKDVVPAGGFLVALQDRRGTGKADVIRRFGETKQSGGAGGTGIAFYDNALYAEINDRIVKYALAPGEVVPQQPPATVVSGLPLNGQHPMHPFFIAGGYLYVDLGSATNACQTKNLSPNVPGSMPCTELETRGGIWRYDATKTNQKFSSAQRYATGIRNSEGYAIDTIQHRLLVTQHGRDQLHSLWPNLYKVEEEATLPSEELLVLQPGGDYGWPECYYDPARRSLVLAPEYGGDGGKTVGPCADKLGPLLAFPAHWAPMAMAFYDRGQFPSRYRDGVFIAFHGSWNRAPFEQQGYNVVFQSLAGGQSAARCEIFADGFAGAIKTPEKASHRPSGLAVGPDGALYVADDIGGRIYKIVYRANTGEAGAASTFTPCPSLTAPPEPAAQIAAKSSPDAKSEESRRLLVPKGATPEMLVLGARIYRGEMGNATCTGCHGETATGTPLGPDLTDKTWLWGDGSLSGITKTIIDGVPAPKQYRSPMPPMGGAQLAPDQAAAVAAYVWALSHSD